MDGRPIRSLSDAEAFLDGLVNLERRRDWRGARLGLEPIRALLERVGNPERGLVVVHVAGSKGKGSVALLSEALFGALGRRVGTFTSPHLTRWTERFRIGGREADPSTLADVLERLRPHVEELRRAADPRLVPSFFDVTAAAALLLFAREGAEVAVLEVGLGGRLDSTNVVLPAVACITTIEYEHTERLGGTLSAIAREKAGILKPGCAAVCGELPEPALRVVEERARSLGVPLRRLGREIRAERVEASLDGVRFRYRDSIAEGFETQLDLPLLGPHQASNAALALACVRLAVPNEAERLRKQAPRALASLRLPARIELVAKRPWILLDTAHTPRSADALARVLAWIPSRSRRLLLSISAGKDVHGILKPLLPGADRVVLTRAEPSRSLAPEVLAQAVRRLAPAAELILAADPAEALRLARDGLEPEGLLCVAGSVYLAGIARRALVGEPAGAAAAR